MYPYFVIGYYFARYKRLFRSVESAKWVLVWLYVSLMIFYEKKHYIYTSGVYGTDYQISEYILLNGYRWLIGLLGSIAVIVVIIELLKLKPISLLGDKIAVLGKRSLQIYVLSVVFLSTYLPIFWIIVRKVPFIDRVYNMLSFYAVVYDLVFTLFIAMAYAIILVYVSKLLEKIKVSKLIFGR